MEVIRTANAGVLLTLDDKRILLDGVCREVKPYLATPPMWKECLSSNWPDAVVFTHVHEDHCDPSYISSYFSKTGKCVYGTSQMEQLAPNAVKTEATALVGSIRLTAVPTRHMGHYGKTTEHQSYVVQGSSTVWFMGDASPLELKKFSGFPKPDVLIVSYPYVSTPPALKLLEGYLPCKILLLHMPDKAYDPEGVWQMIQFGTKQLQPYVFVPEMGESLNL